MWLLDTSAWIELFLKSPNDTKVKEVLDKADCFTSIVSLAEISNWAAKNGLNIDKIIRDITKLTPIIKLTPQIAVKAGKLNVERKKKVKKWGMMDSIVLTTARIFDLKILTKDTDFSDLENAEIL